MPSVGGRRSSHRWPDDMGARRTMVDPSEHAGVIALLLSAESVVSFVEERGTPTIRNTAFQQFIKDHIQQYTLVEVKRWEILLPGC